MPHITDELSTEWLNFVKASLVSRIRDAETVTQKVLGAVQTLAHQLENKDAFDSLLALKSEVALPSDVLPMLQNVLKHLGQHDELSQLIAPLYTVLQFEDRTRQKMEGLIGVMDMWAQVRNDDSISDEAIATGLMTHVVSMDQQEILAKHFPDYITVEEVSDELELF